MIKLSYACHALIIFFQPRVVISLPPNELRNGASGNVVGVTTLDQQDPLSVSVHGDLTATLFHGATNALDNSAVNPSDSQKSNLSPYENFDSTPGGANGGDNMALSLDESTGGGGVTDYLIPSVPIQILEGVPQVIDDLREWFNNPKKPECRNNKHALCCQKGGPHIIDGNPRPGGRRPSVAPKVLFDPIEYSQRRRVCRSWSADHPACQFPENLFCCYCQDYNSIAYFCYNQPYTDLAEFKGKPIPEPRQIPKPPEDPNPVEQPSQKRNIDSPAPLPNAGPLLYAEHISFIAKEKRGRNRKPDSCTDKFLESVGVSTCRYKYPSKLQPDRTMNWDGEREILSDPMGRIS